MDVLEQFEQLSKEMLSLLNAQDPDDERLLRLEQERRALLPQIDGVALRSVPGAAARLENILAINQRLEERVAACRKGLSEQLSGKCQQKRAVKAYERFSK